MHQTSVRSVAKTESVKWSEPKRLYMSETETGSDEIPRPRNEITVRDYERRQLVEFIPDLIDHYEERNGSDAADRIDEMLDLFDELYETFDEEIDGTEASYDVGADNWRDLALALEELDNTRASWLRAKIGRRAELPVIHMGFTTNVPFMALQTGQEPKRPDR